MRISCLECVVKHLGSAAVYIEEVEQGYPNYYGYVYGELDHAASECYAHYPDLAMTIREHRIQWSMARKEGKQNSYVVPFEALFAYIDVLEAIGDAELQPEVPAEASAGLPRDEHGNVKFSMDTRPPDLVGVDSSNFQMENQEVK